MKQLVKATFFVVSALSSFSVSAFSAPSNGTGPDAITIVDDPSVTPTPETTSTPTSTPEPSLIPTAVPTIVVEPTATPTPTPEPTATPIPEPTATPTPTAAPSSEPTATPTPAPTATPTPEATATPTPEATATPTPEPTVTPTPEPTSTPTPEPTATPTPEPTSTPTPEPTPAPESEPTPISEPEPTPRPSLGLKSLSFKGNNISTANALESACTASDLSNGFASACAALAALVNVDGEQAALSDGEIDAIITDISAEEILTQRRLLSELSRSKTSRLYKSMATLRANKNALSLAYDGESLNYGAGAGDAMSSPWNFLSSVYVHNSQYQKTAYEAAYDASADGALVGLSYRVSPSLFFGTALDWTTYDVEFENESGEMEAKQYSLTGFLSWYLKQFSLEAQLGYSVADTDFLRNLNFAGGSQAESENAGEQVDFSLQSEWNWQISAVNIRPYLRLDYLNIGIDGFKEEGDSEWLVAVEDQRSEQLNATLGLATRFSVSYDWGLWLPSLTLSSVQKTALGDSKVDFSFANSSSQELFSLTADEDEELFYEAQLNSVFVLKNGVSAFISGSSILGHEYMDGYEVSAGLNFEF